MTRCLKIILLLFASLALLSCKSITTSEPPVASSTSAGAAVPTSSTPGPSPFPLMPTSTPVPPTPTSTTVPSIPTNTPTPTSLNSTGPYVIFFGHGGIWISNPDGSFPTRLSDMDISQGNLDWRRNISPTGDRLALVVSSEEWLDLAIVKIPSGEMETITHLISRPSPEHYDPISPNAFATYAIRDYDSLAWQPGDGRLLAFIGATNGATADLYLYDTKTGEITQLTDGPSQAVLPVWSPDGQYILHFGVSWVPPFGGAIVGANRLDGVWAVQASAGKVITLPKPEGSLPNFIGWLDNSHYITYDSSECNSQNLRSIDVVTRKATPIMEASFYNYIDLSPESGTILFSSAEGCPNSLSEGIYQLPAGQTTPIMLSDKRAWEVEWMPESNVFFAYPEALFSSDGQIRYDPPVYDSSFDPAISKAGHQAWNVIQKQVGHVEVRVAGGEWQTIMTGSIDKLIWDPLDGDTLLIALEDGALYSAVYPDFFQRLMGDLEGGVIATFWIP